MSHTIDYALIAAGVLITASAALVAACIVFPGVIPIAAPLSALCAKGAVAKLSCCAASSLATYAENKTYRKVKSTFFKKSYEKVSKKKALFFSAMSGESPKIYKDSPADAPVMYGGRVETPSPIRI